MNDANEPVDDITLIYDGECPVCTAYSCNVDPGPANLNRVNARSGNAEVQKAIEAGCAKDGDDVVCPVGASRGAWQLRLAKRGNAWKLAAFVTVE